VNDNDLRDVNDWLAEFGVTMFCGEDGKYRIWGDINRIQDIVDSPDASNLPPGALGDLNDFFTNEVDGKFAEMLLRQRFRLPNNAPEVGPDEEQPSTEQVDACTKATYDYFRVPPDERQG
jgi:hypothetical protein